MILVSLGIDEKGMKHVFGLHEGATENAGSCTALLANLVERGLDPTRSVLVVIDGGKALRKGCARFSASGRWCSDARSIKSATCSISSLSGCARA